MSSMGKLVQPRYRVNQEPRISANQLAEYVLASPTRRQSILKNAKFSPTFLVIRYQSAKDAICRHLADDTRNLGPLISAHAEQLELSKAGGSAFQANDALLSAEAIQAFMDMRGRLQKELPAASYRPNSQNLPKLECAGVDISIRLDLVSYNNAKETVGGVILQVSKAVAAKSWREEHSKIVAALVWLTANRHLSSLGKVDRKLCMALDVFTGKAVTAPANYKRILNDIEASCREIAALWPAISQPADFND